MKLHSFKISQPIKTSRRKAYATWTNLKLAKQFAAPPGCTTISFKSNFKVGGNYQTVMATPNGKMKSSGEYLAIEPGLRIVQTFIWDASETELNVIIIEFTDRGKNSTMNLTGLGFADKGEGASNKSGWSESLQQFANYFER